MRKAPPAEEESQGSRMVLRSNKEGWFTVIRALGKVVLAAFACGQAEFSSTTHDGLYAVGFSGAGMVARNI